MDGILVIDKPEGPTSHDIVAIVRRVTKTRKVGHAGTLDPFATGVLVVGVNQGTKLLQFLQGDEKEYEATVRLGIETDTLDRDGKVVSEAPCPGISYEEVERILASFVGRQSQIPPVYAAIKKDGVPHYKLARKGLSVEVTPRDVEIHSITRAKLDLPYLSFTVRCSSGTYVRSLARDIGRKVGCGGHLTALRRVSSGRFGIETAIPLERFKEMGENWVDAASGLREALSLHEVDVDQLQAENIRMGREVTLNEDFPGNIFMLTCSGKLVAVAEKPKGEKVRLVRVFNS